MDTNTTDEIYLKANGKNFSNLKSISLHASLEALPRSFMMEYIDVDTVSSIPLNSQIEISTKNNGNIFKGYAENRSIERTATSQTMQLSGRSLARDLMDGAAMMRQSQLPATYQLLTKMLCDGKGVQYSYKTGSDNQPLTGGINIGVNESAFTILERAARYEGYLIYDSWDGYFVVSTPQTAPVASITAGMVTQASIHESVADRFYEYIIVRSPNSVANSPDDEIIEDGIAKDAYPAGMNTNRKMVVVNSRSDGTIDYSQRLAQWYANRAYGKSLSLELVIPAWTYKAGKYWDINQCVNVEIPGVYQTSVTHKPLLISEVTLSFSIQNGTEARLRLTYPEAYSIEPLQISPNAASNFGIPNNNIGLKTNLSDG